MSRLFLIEKSRFVVIRNERDEEVGFSSFEEFLRYCPVAEFGFDPAGKTYVDYEPPRKLHIDEAAGLRIGGEDIEAVETYENLIDNVLAIRARVEDPFYGKSLTEAKEIKRGIVNREADAELLAKFTLTELLAVAVGARVASQELKDAVGTIEGARTSALVIVGLANTIAELRPAKAK